MNVRRHFSSRNSSIIPALLIAIFTTMFVTTTPASAGLGQEVSSVQADQVHMQAKLHTTKAEAYEVQEIDAPTGIVVREYVAAGKVFAVAWHGPWPPDMRQILASYFDTYVKAAQAQASSHAGRRPLRIEQPGLVVETGGHVRSFVGRAYVPDLLPQGMSVEAIQ
jgi:hypothetical protein